MTVRHGRAIASIVASLIETEQPRVGRRLLTSHLRAVVEQPDEQLARSLGVHELVERARDEHLATLDADAGLAALCVSWEDVVAEAVALLDRTPHRCARCGARLSRRRPVCARCRLPSPRPRNR